MNDITLTQLKIIVERVVRPIFAEPRAASNEFATRCLFT